MCGYGYQRTLRIERMGLVPYAPMHELQQARHAEVAAGRSDDTLFLLEHDPVITLGRNGGDDHVLLDREALAARGVALVVTGRGGDVTYHGPGQVVGYPIIDLSPDRKDVRRYVRDLEEIMIRTAADYGLEASRIDGLNGAWVGDRKIGAVGVRISRWVTMHGFALNASTDLDQFRVIVPCGIQGKGVTSLVRELGREIETDEVLERIEGHAANIFEAELELSSEAPLAGIDESAWAPEPWRDAAR